MIDTETVSKVQQASGYANNPSAAKNAGVNAALDAATGGRGMVTRRALDAVMRA
jgi:hypothetical protein